MGLFGKKDACPVCGGEVKGLFNKKISGKKVLCKDCSAQISMMDALLKEATPEYIKEHLEEILAQIEENEKNAPPYEESEWDEDYLR